MTSHQFREYVEEQGIHHEFTPYSCPEKNAYVEAYFWNLALMPPFARKILSEFFS